MPNGPHSNRNWRLTLNHCPRVGDFVDLGPNGVFVVESVTWYPLQNERVEILVRELD